MTFSRARLRGLALVAAAGTLAAACTILDVRASVESRWSDPATWGGRPPRAGDAVTIPAGRSIVLDVSPPPLASLDVDGGLRFADERDLVLRAGGVRVRGRLEIGGARPFSHRAEIVLAGTPDGRGAIVVSGGGRLDLHGVPRLSWTTLDATAVPGQTRIVLARPVDWIAGDRIVLAPSGFAADDAEEAVVAAVDGARVTLAAPLARRHWGTVTDGIDERAEVGLLSHNVVVRSDDASAASGNGGQVVVLRGGTLVASGVAFRALGQRGKKGRYPIHFHEVGDGSASSVVDSSIVHSLNRCLTIHGTSDVTVRSDVAYDTFGHCYFLEDGVERGNLFEDDLGLETRAPAPADTILATDVRPATFWIANPDNVVRGDRAAGSAGYGFWYDLDAAPVGLARGTPGVRPRHIALGTFADDVAHANEHDGLFVDNLRNPPGVREAPNYEPPVTASFVRFTSYKNRRHGVWLRGRRLALEGARLADDAIGATFAAAEATIHGGLVVGETGNRTGPPKPFDPGFPIRGFEFYDGPVRVDGVRFANFVPNATRAASALSALEFSPFFMDPTHAVRGVTFENALPVYFRPYDPHAAAADGYRSVAFADLDGSVTGEAGTTVVYGSPLLAEGCRAMPAWNAAVCRTRIGSLFILDLDRVAAGAGPVRVTRADRPAEAIALGGNPAGAGPNVNFQTNLPVGERYAVTFAGRPPAAVRLGLHGAWEGDAIVVDLPQEAGCPHRVTLIAHGSPGRAAAVADLRCGANIRPGSAAVLSPKHAMQAAQGR